MAYQGGVVDLLRRALRPVDSAGDRTARPRRQTSPSIKLNPPRRKRFRHRWHWPAPFRRLRRLLSGLLRRFIIRATMATTTRSATMGVAPTRAATIATTPRADTMAAETRMFGRAMPAIAAIGPRTIPTSHTMARGGNASELDCQLQTHAVFSIAVGNGGHCSTSHSIDAADILKPPLNSSALPSSLTRRVANSASSSNSGA